MTSPAEVAAQTAAPPASPILVPAEIRVLSTDVVTRGTGRFGTPLEVSLAPSRMKPESLIVTSLPSLGTEVKEGDVLLTASGRPLIVLVGEVPVFRDLGPGMSGEDVRQFEEALDRLGHQPGIVDGSYDPDTEAAVLRLYASAGFVAAVATQEQLAELYSGTSDLFDHSTPGPGAQVLADEILFVPVLPALVAQQTIPVGQPVEGPILTLTGSNVAIDGSLPIEQSGLVTAGMVVTIDEPDLGIEASGVVNRVAQAPGTDGVDGFHIYMEILVADAPPALINASVRLTVPIESTSSEVLVVPITALALAPDGSSQVQVQRDSGLQAIEVRPGLSAKGFVEITPVDDTIVPGDLVLIGFDRPGTGNNG